MQTSPPKPRIALRIGVTGHRPDKLGPDAAARIEVALAAAFGAIKGRLELIKQQHPETFDADAPRLSLVTALAEGADRVAAHAAGRHGFLIEAVLPFPREAFESDFETAESRKEFDDLLKPAAAVLEFDLAAEVADPETARNAGYEEAGLMVLRQCDLLVAIWNGKPAEGRAGTAEVVEAARQSGIPCLWYDSTTGEARIRKPKVRLIDLGASDDEWAAFTPETLNVLVDGLVVAPAEEKRGVLSAVVKASGTNAARYLKETLPASNGVFIAYPMLVDLVLLQWGRVWNARKSYVARGQAGVDPTRGWGDAYWAAIEPELTCHAPAMRSLLEARYLWADQLAAYYAQRYRSTYVTLFLLAPLVVSCAVIGYMVHHDIYWLSKTLGFLELLLIGGMVGLGIFGRRQNWHQLWIDYRQLAEMLRHARILVLTGTSLPEMHATPEPGALGAGTQWVQWYYRATIRELGLCGTRLDRAHAAKVAELVRTSELAEQIKFHEGNAVRQHRIERGLEYVGLAMLGFSAAAAALHVFQVWEWSGLSFFSIALPAFGAALFAIRAQGDFGGVAHRAEAMAVHLKMLDREIEAQQKAGITVALLAACADAAADTMLSEVSQWRQIFFSKRLALPA